MNKKFLLVLALFPLLLFSEDSIVVPPCEMCCDPCDPCNQCSYDCIIEREQLYDECYPPPYGNIDCFWGIFVDVSFLYWYGNESNLSYAIKTNTRENGTETSNIVGIAVPSDVICFDFKWKPGVRVGAGWNGNCDGWDIYINWTNYRNCTNENISVDFTSEAPDIGEEGLLDPWENQIAGGTQLFDQIAASWHFKINQLDLEIGRRYWLSPCFTLRPYIGLRGAWTRTKFHVASSRSPFINIDGNLQDGFNDHDMENYFRGGGLLGGLQPNWYFNPCWSVYGNVGAALLWGRNGLERKEVTFGKEVELGTTRLICDFDGKTKAKCFYMQPVLDLGIGLRYETLLCCDRFQLSLDAGWEHHIYLDHNFRYKLYDPAEVAISSTESIAIPGAYDETSHNIQFGGFVLRARFDY